MRLRVFKFWGALMRGGCLTASTEFGQIGLLRRAQEPSAATGCPIGFQQAAPFRLLPERGAQQRKEPGEAVAPLTQPRTEAQQDIGQERRPHLPAHGVGAVAQEVRQLKGLLELFEEHFELAQEREAVARWLAARLFLKNPPTLWSGSNPQANSLLPHQNLNPVGLL